MPQKSSSMEHRVIWLPDIKFWWGYTADDPHTLVAWCLILAESESRICTSRSSSGFFPISSGTITWHMHDGEPTPVQNSSISTRNPDRVWGSKFVVKHSSHQFNQTQIRTRNGLCELVQSDEINSESQTFNWPLALSGWATSFDFRFHLVIEAIIVFGLGTYEYSTHWQPNA